MQVPDLDMLIVPISGGGMISGIAVAAKALKPGIEVIGAEPTGGETALAKPQTLCTRILMHLSRGMVQALQVGKRDLHLLQS